MTARPILTLHRPIPGRARRLPARWLASWLMATACGDGGSSQTSGDAGPGDDAGSSGLRCERVEDLDSCLPAWGFFSPLLPEQEPTLVDETEPVELEIRLERFDETGTLGELGTFTFTCIDRTYAFTYDPERALSFVIDDEVVWPGALVEGRSHRDGDGTLQALPLAERAPIDVTLTIADERFTRRVERPDRSAVGQALGSLVAEAEAQGDGSGLSELELQMHGTASGAERVRTPRDQKRAALSFDVSGRYLGFEAAAPGPASPPVGPSVVSALFVDEVFVADATLPDSPTAVFGGDLAPDGLAPYVDAGRLGPNNPPAYVSRVGYGRMLMFTLSAMAGETELLATVQAIYSAVVSGSEPVLSVEQQAILRSASIRVAQRGGEVLATSSLIRSGDLRPVFSDPISLASAAPIRFELTSLRGRVATVSETGTFTETDCQR